jgi:spermidine synthase
VTQWVPIYDSDMETVQSEIATFFEVFPNGTLWSNNVNQDGYDLVLLGQSEPLRVSVDRVQEKLDRPDHAAVAKSLRDVGLYSGVDILATYAGQAADMRPWLNGAQINSERNLRLQYLAGMGLNSIGIRTQNIYNSIIEYRRFPEELLSGSTGRMGALRTLLYTSPRRAR